MNKKNKLKNVKLLLVAVALSFASCKKSDTTSKTATEEDKTTKYALVTSVGQARGTNFYLQGFNSLSEKNTYDNANAVEIVSAGGSGIYVNNGALFTNQYLPNSVIKRWEQNNKGVFEQKGELNVSEMGYQGNIYFKDATTAFAVGPNSTKVLIFNPVTMVKTGYIDFTAKSRLGEVTNFPAAGNKINMQLPTEMIVRDNYLFVGFMMVFDYGKSTLATNTADMLVIDLSKVNNSSADNAGAVVKWISSDKGSSLGSSNSGSGSKFMITDEKGDIYLLCHNFWGGAKATIQKPSGIIRIKKGTTDFDPNYHFDLENVVNSQHPVMNIEYAGNGKFFAAILDITAVNPNNPYSYYTDPISRWYRFDLYDKSAKRVNETLTRGTSVSLTYFENGKAYIPYDTEKEKFVQEVDVNTLENKRIFSTNGSPMVFKLK